ncbi:EPIDERMAL PATTERNING FACTOR 1 [Spatholobus suberectus]|nr:EPIDERMAL PATTERNING FACTOR 1 [Spatholobus suberectus]
MRRSCVYAAAIVLLLLYVPLIISARHINRSRSLGHGHPDRAQENTKDGISKVAKQNLHWEGRVTRKRIRGLDTLLVAGSRLPDCSHACGSCSPCRLVMVSFVCASLAEAESCPMAYKCMCHNKSYPVP